MCPFPCISKWIEEFPQPVVQMAPRAKFPFWFKVNIQWAWGRLRPGSEWRKISMNHDRPIRASNSSRYSLYSMSVVAIVEFEPRDWSISINGFCFVSNSLQSDRTVALSAGMRINYRIWTHIPIQMRILFFGKIKRLCINHWSLYQRYSIVFCHFYLYISTVCQLYT